MHENDNNKHTKSWMQQAIMKLHEILVKLHVQHVQNRATIQPQSPIQVLVQIYPKQQHGILNA